MKIAQITWNAFPNFGTALQAYALQQTLRKMGHSPVLIDDRRFTWLAFNRQELLRWVKGFVIRPLKTWRRFGFARSFNAFKHRYLTIRSDWRSKEDLVAEGYDAYVCGSDQIWSPLLPNHHDGFYFAAFAPAGARLVAYAPSLGAKTYSEDYATMVRPWLDRFNGLAIREEAGARIVEEITGRKDVHTVVDPTLLLTSGEWQSFVNQQITPPQLPRAIYPCLLPDL